MIDVVIQGPLTEVTPRVIDQFSQKKWIDRIILSSWDTDSWSDSNGKYINVWNKDVTNPGVGNRNRHIKSAREGLKFVSSEIAIKVRSDQIIKDLDMMKDFYDEHHTGEQLFVLGMYWNYPFHPRDHFFMGPTKNLQLLFNCPLDTYSGPVDYTKCLRAEAWIGSHYYARHSPRIAEMLQEPLQYLVDGAPLHEQAMIADFEIRDKLFHPFPRINMEWPKHNLATYHYDVAAEHSEYWYEDSIIV